jgi:hypothetical protein
MPTCSRTSGLSSSTRSLISVPSSPAPRARESSPA